MYPPFLESDPPSIEMPDYVSNELEFSRPGTDARPSTHILYTEHTYDSETALRAASHCLTAVGKQAREHEPGALMLGALTFPPEKDKLAILEVYESQEY